MTCAPLQLLQSVPPACWHIVLRCASGQPSGWKGKGAAPVAELTGVRSAPMLFMVQGLQRMALRTGSPFCSARLQRRASVSSAPAVRCQSRMLASHLLIPPRGSPKSGPRIAPRARLAMPLPALPSCHKPPPSSPPPPSTTIPSSSPAGAAPGANSP